MEIGDGVYREVARRLLGAMGEAAFFNGSVVYEDDTLEGTLRCTLIIYREEVDDAAGRFSRMAQVVPVWWEFDTATADGPVPNDFSWRTFVNFLY